MAVNGLTLDIKATAEEFTFEATLALPAQGVSIIFGPSGSEIGRASCRERV